MSFRVDPQGAQTRCRVLGLGPSFGRPVLLGLICLTEQPAYPIHGSLGFPTDRSSPCSSPCSAGRNGHGRKPRTRQDVDGRIVIGVGLEPAGSARKHRLRRSVVPVDMAALLGLRRIGRVYLDHLLDLGRLDFTEDVGLWRRELLGRDSRKSPSMGRLASVPMPCPAFTPTLPTVSS